MKHTVNQNKPAVFIGSSSEGLEVARAIEYQLAEDGEITIWKDGVFGLGLGTLESLVAALQRFDFAILVLTPDDVVVSREVTSQAPRDNVMFELGLFMGTLGRERTFVVCSNSRDMKLPSDLAGVTVTRYEANRIDENLLAALGPGCTLIRMTMREQGPRKIQRDLPTQGIEILQEIVTNHDEKWTVSSGAIHRNDIYLHEISESLGEWIIEYVEVRFEYQYWFVEGSKADTAEVNFRYKATDTPAGHSWHELLRYAFQRSKTVWKPVRFTIRHSDIRMAWLNFTLLHGGQMLKVRNLRSKLLVRPRTA